MTAPERSDGQLTSWDSRRRRGVWEASVTLTNAWVRPSHVTVKITAVRRNGKTSTDTVTDFYLPPSGSSTLAYGDNALHGNGTSGNDILAVTFTVVEIRTTDLQNAVAQGTVDAPSSTAVAPSVG